MDVISEYLDAKASPATRIRSRLLAPRILSTGCGRPVCPGDTRGWPRPRAMQMPSGTARGSAPARLPDSSPQHRVFQPCDGGRVTESNLALTGEAEKNSNDLIGLS